MWTSSDLWIPSAALWGWRTQMEVHLKAISNHFPSSLSQLSLPSNYCWFIRSEQNKSEFLAVFESSIWWVFGGGPASWTIWTEEKTCLCSEQKEKIRASVTTPSLCPSLRNNKGQSRLLSRCVLVLPLGQTASELLSQRSLARWRTASCPGASRWRSEDRNTVN